MEGLGDRAQGAGFGGDGSLVCSGRDAHGEVFLDRVRVEHHVGAQWPAIAARRSTRRGTRTNTERWSLVPQRHRLGGPHLDSRSDERGHPIEAPTVDRLGDVGVDDLGNVARDLFAGDQVDGSSGGVGDCGRRRLRGSGAVRIEPAEIGPDGLAGALRGLSERTLDVGGDVVEVEGAVEVKVEPAVEPPGAVAVRGGESLGSLSRVGWAPGGGCFFGERDCRRGRVSALEPLGPPAGHPGQGPLLFFGDGPVGGRARFRLVAGSLWPAQEEVVCHRLGTCVRSSPPGARDDYRRVTCNCPVHARFRQHTDCPGSRLFAREVPESSFSQKSGLDDGTCAQPSRFSHDHWRPRCRQPHRLGVHD